jgi:lysophospholipase L1-like esterase
MKARRFSHPVIFIGDSHTQTIGALPNALNFGATGSTTTGAQIVVKRNAKKLAEASAVMLMIGTNDVWRHKLAGLDDRLAAIEQDIPRDVTLIWSGIPPANDVRIEPADIARANVTIQKLCASNPRCTYVDTWALLGDSDGMPDPRYFLPDGVHFAPRGYERWLGTLLDTLEYQP